MNPKEKPDSRPLTLSEISEAAKKRVALISREFKDGFEFIENYPRSVTFFGSARTKEGDFYYEKARSLAKKIVEETHYSIITGGGPGIMEAANRGAFEAGGNSIGLTIELPHEQVTNKYITHKLGFHYFFSRKVCLAFSAEAYIFFPGGFGTMDEFVEILTLIQTNKIPRAPMILVGENWKELDSFFKDVLVKKGFIEEGDIRFYTITDDESEILEIIKKAPVRIGEKYDSNTDISPEKTDHGEAEGPITELSKKHCVPCEEGDTPFSHEESERMLKEISEWTLLEDKEIEKTYSFKDFSEAMNFMNAVANIAEKEGHHPEIKLHDFKKVDVRIWTHAIDGLSENDFILAAKIDEIVRDKKF